MNEPWTWTEDDILSLISTQTKESLTLDYKRAASLALGDKEKTEISKDISAFANSAGGSIVYGVIEDKYIPTGIDVCFDPRGKVNKEWLEQVINSTIQPRIAGVRIHEVDLKTKAPGKVLYVVNVPQSNTAHMAADHRYYKRYNFQSVAMEDYEVRDVFARSQAPDLSIEPIFADGSTAMVLQRPDLVGIQFRISNASPKPAEYVFVILQIDKQLRPIDVKDTHSRAGEGYLLIQSGQIPVELHTVTRGIPGKLPIWRGLPFSLLDHPIFLMFPHENDVHYIGWEIHAPGMNAKNGLTRIRSLGNTVRFMPY